MTEYDLPEPGANYIPEIKAKCYWKVAIRGNRVVVIEMGGPLQPIVFEITAENNLLEVTDFWGWGAG